MIESDLELESVKILRFLLLVRLLLHVLVLGFDVGLVLLLVAVGSRRENVLALPLHVGFHELNLLTVDDSPLPRLFRPVVELLEVAPTLGLALLCGGRKEALLGEVHDAEDVATVFLGVANAEVEPLLVAARVGVHLHVQLVLCRAHVLRLQQVSALKDRVKDQNVIVVLGEQLFLLFGRLL